VVRDLRRFKGGAVDFRCWLFTIGRHRAVDASRTRMRMRSRGDLLTAALAPMAEHNPVEHEVLEGLSTQQAVALVAGLSRDQAEAVALRIIAGLDLLGPPDPAVDRLVRALTADGSADELADRDAARSMFRDSRRRPRRRYSLPLSAAAAAVVVAAGLASAYAAVLPAPVQHFAYRLLAGVGVPDAHHPAEQPGAITVPSTASNSAVTASFPVGWPLAAGRSLGPGCGFSSRSTE
jgi:hypothetical protein